MREHLFIVENGNRTGAERGIDSQDPHGRSDKLAGFIEAETRAAREKP
jgi:hypothetical protein